MHIDEYQRKKFNFLIKVPAKISSRENEWNSFSIEKHFVIPENSEPMNGTQCSLNVM